MKNIKAILLDIDGTVLDTSEFIYQAAEYALAQNGYRDIPRSKIALAVGLPFDDFYQHILDTRDLDMESLQTAHRIFQLEHMDLSVPFPGAVETLSSLKERGYMLAAVTSRYRLSVLPTLDAAKLTHLFSRPTAQ